MAGIVASLVAVCGCATWSSRAEDAAAAASIAARETWAAARPVLHARCMAAAVECASAGTHADKCQRWAACSALRRNTTAAIYALHSISAQVIAAVRNGDRPRAEQLEQGLARARDALRGLLRQVQSAGDDPP